MASLKIMQMSNPASFGDDAIEGTASELLERAMVMTGDFIGHISNIGRGEVVSNFEGNGYICAVSHTEDDVQACEIVHTIKR